MKCVRETTKDADEISFDILTCEINRRSLGKTIS